MTGTAVLNQDGTLSVTLAGSSSVTTFTLDSVTADALTVSGTDSTGTWTDTWYLSQPAGWLSSSSAIAFSSQMLDGQPVYYNSYAGNSDGTIAAGTTQETYAITGSSGNYQITITQDYFDASNVWQSGTTMTGTVVLNQDGTLTVSLVGNPPDVTFTLNSVNANSLVVTGTTGVDTWTDTWYLTQPAGWLNVPGMMAVSFTTQMLDAHPIFYISYGGNADGTLTTGTTQESFAFTGSGGSYSVTGSQEYFDAANVSQGVVTMTGTAALNQDGTLTVNLTGNPTLTFTLNSAGADALVVTGTSGTDTWTDTWYLSQPAGWLSAP